MMKDRNRHFIQKQSIEIRFEKTDNSTGLQNHVGEVFYEKLLPRMEDLFDEMFGKNYYASIDKLEIDCGFINQKNWEQEFTEQFIRKLKEELVRVNKKEIDFKKIEEMNAFETFFYFIENGYLPWNSRTLSIREIEQLISRDGKFISRLKELIRKKEAAGERLVNQFSENFTEKVIQLFIADDKTGILQKIFSKADRLPSVKKNVWIEILKTSSPDENIAGELSKPFEDKRIEERKKNAEREKIPDALYIGNSGLVILHPFLPALFGNIGYLEKDEWLNDEVQQRAVALTQFMITGNEEYPEFDLILNKILCGYDIDKTLPADIVLSEFEKSEATDLLESVIKHWSVLKNTSAEGLRNTFFLRDGKLTMNEEEWLLKVEQKSVDILLNKLPWGISIIKLPWMNGMLKVEWN